MESLSRVWGLSHLPSLLTDESGQDISEYAVLIGLVAIVVIASVMLLGESVVSIFEDIGSSLTLQ